LHSSRARSGSGGACSGSGGPGSRGAGGARTAAVRNALCGSGRVDFPASGLRSGRTCSGRTCSGRETGGGPGPACETGSSRGETG